MFYIDVVDIESCGKIKTFLEEREWMFIPVAVSKLKRAFCATKPSRAHISSIMFPDSMTPHRMACNKLHAKQTEFGTALITHARNCAACFMSPLTS
jgi:hypothetical protein